MRPESFAHWSPDTPRTHTGFIVRLGAEADVEACTQLAAAIGAGPADAWRQTLARTVRDGQQRAWIPPGGQPQDAHSQQFHYADLAQPDRC
jgi:hypothetical protein